MRDELALLPAYLTAHLRLSLLALALGAGLSLPLAISASRRPRLAAAVLAVSGVFQTIPSLALLAFMVPALAAFSQVAEPLLGFRVRSIGFLPALVALSLYSTLPILHNTVAGLQGVPEALREAARGVGMTSRQQLLRVELPVARPVIVAGLRTAAVWVVGTATLSTPVGATSLGNFIFSGLQTRNFRAVSIGCVAAAALALVLDRTLRSFEGRGRSPGRRLALGLGATAALGAVLWGPGGLGGRSPAPTDRPTLRIGAKTFSEQYILAELLSGWLRERGDWSSETISSLGSSVVFDALRGGELDLYVDYSGTLWANVLGERGTPPSRDAVLRGVRERLAAQFGIEVAAALGFENSYALAMPAARARALRLGSLSALAPASPRLTIGGDYEFFARPEWRSLVARYGFRFRGHRSMDASLMYQAAAAGEVDVISAFSTDGRIAAFDLAVLDDDLGVIPPYDALILARSAVLRDFPGLAQALAELDGAIDAAAMRELNRRVDLEGLPIRAVADAFREELGRRRDGLRAADQGGE